jgi:hypothetical protein
MNRPVINSTPAIHGLTSHEALFAFIHERGFVAADRSLGGYRIVETRTTIHGLTFHEGLCSHPCSLFRCGAERAYESAGHQLYPRPSMALLLTIAASTERSRGTKQQESAFRVPDGLDACFGRAGENPPSGHSTRRDALRYSRPTVPSRHRGHEQT